MILTNMKALVYMFTCWESNLCAFLFWCQLCDQERLHTLLYYRSIALAANKAELPDMKMLALFGFGTVILRGAACTVNDLLDRDIDKKVTFLSFFLTFGVMFWLVSLSPVLTNVLIEKGHWIFLGKCMASNEHI